MAEVSSAKQIALPGEGALGMLNRGYKVFPIIQNEKIPAVPKWQTWAQQCSKETILEYSKKHPLSNWGIACGPSGLIVLDVDTKNGKTGPDSLCALEEMYGPIPKTFTVLTPTNAPHYYLRGLSRSTVQFLGPGLDTRSKGGYVVCPGSVINGKKYRAVNNLQDADAPGWFLELLEKKRYSFEPIPGLDGIELNKPHHIQSVIDYLLNEAPESIENQGGNNTLYVVACMVKNLGISDVNLAKELIATHYDAIKCHPSWLANESDQNQWESTINSAYRGSQEPAGSRTPEAKELELKRDFSAMDDGPKHISAYRGKAPERQWLIRDWIPLREVTSLYGSGGTGKSLIMQQLAISASTGINFLCLKIEKAIPVLCVFCEDSDEELHRRKNDITHATELVFAENLIHDAPLYFWSRVGQNNDIGREAKDGKDIEPGLFRARLELELAKMPKGDKLLILDTLSDVYLGNENVRELVNKFVKTHLGSLIRKHDITVIVLAHPSRSGRVRGDLLSGSTAWENAVRNRLGLMEHKDHKNILILKRIKSNYAKRGEEILLQWDCGRFYPADLAKVTAESLTIDQIELIQIIAKHITAGERKSSQGISKIILHDESLQRLFKAKSLSTVERFIEKTLQYPRRLDKTQYRYEEKKIVGTQVKHWVVAEEYSDEQKGA